VGADRTGGDGRKVFTPGRFFRGLEGGGKKDESTQIKKRGLSEEEAGQKRAVGIGQYVTPRGHFHRLRDGVGKSVGDKG